jgi:MFS family permease
MTNTVVDFVNPTGCVENLLQGEFDWDKKLQGFILSSYFFGYLSTQVLGGWLGGRYGAKHVASCGLLLSIAATVLLPVAARFSPYLVIVLRIIVGASSVSSRGVPRGRIRSNNYVKLFACLFVCAQMTCFNWIPVQHNVTSSTMQAILAHSLFMISTPDG